jgi:hypothetical protein
MMSLLYLFLLLFIIPVSTHGEINGWKDPNLPEYLIPEDAKMCRHKSYLPVALFELDSCAWCYKYMPNTSVTFGTPSVKLKASFVEWMRSETNGSFMVLTLKNDNGSRVSISGVIFINWCDQSGSLYINTCHKPFSKLVPFSLYEKILNISDPG